MQQVQWGLGSPRGAASSPPAVHPPRLSSGRMRAAYPQAVRGRKHTQECPWGEPAFDPPKPTLLPEESQSEKPHLEPYPTGQTATLLGRGRWAWGTQFRPRSGPAREALGSAAKHLDSALTLWSPPSQPPPAWRVESPTDGRVGQSLLKIWPAWL